MPGELHPLPLARPLAAAVHLHRRFIEEWCQRQLHTVSLRTLRLRVGTERDDDPFEFRFRSGTDNELHFQLELDGVERELQPVALSIESSQRDLSAQLFNSIRQPQLCHATPYLLAPTRGV